MKDFNKQRALLTTQTRNRPGDEPERLLKPSSLTGWWKAADELYITPTDSPKTF
jgi:hypothetical protein